MSLGAGELVSLKLEDYEPTDPIVCYVDPNAEDNPDCSNSEKITDLMGLRNNPDSLPMFRLLAGKNSMTFTDPKLGLRNMMSLVVPDVVTVPFANLYAQLSGGETFSANYANGITGVIIGAIGGVNVQEHGSSLVETSSGLAKHTEMLTNGDVDVKRYEFNAAYNTSESWPSYVMEVALAAGASALVADYLPFPYGKIAKAAIGVGAAAGITSSVVTAVGAGIADLASSHNYPIEKKFKDWMLNDSVHIYEDFLYERPFVNLALNDIHTLDTLSKMSDSNREKSTLNRNCFYIGSKDGVNCAIGLFKLANDLNSTQKNQPLSGLTTPLRFKSESDWSKIGVKVDRWERVDGLTPNGELAKNSVPIRHVERYSVPAITVDNWIEKYSFVVDDLMPHRLRQIRMNFNYQEEIAWECDVTKDPSAGDACTVYKRTSGSEWTELRKEKHPVKKNGQFDFEPRKYGYDNLLTIQKDNQNTVTISTVNKIGLSNTQRFYYLFKATDNLLEPVWPKPDVVVNRISDFEAYASVLDYQDFSVEGMRDSVWYAVDGVRQTFGNLQDMEFSRSEGSGNFYRSRISHSNLSEGEYHWVFNAIIHNSAGESNDSNDVYDVPFNVDVTPPNFELSVDNQCMNPDSSVFIARFAWGDSTIPDIRAMRWQLEKNNGSDFSLVTAMPSLYDVTSKDFAVAWDKVSDRESLQDGLYRVKALAIQIWRRMISPRVLSQKLLAETMEEPTGVDSMITVSMLRKNR